MFCAHLIFFLLVQLQNHNLTCFHELSLAEKPVLLVSSQPQCSRLKRDSSLHNLCTTQYWDIKTTEKRLCFNLHTIVKFWLFNVLSRHKLVVALDVSERGRVDKQQETSSCCTWPTRSFVGWWLKHKTCNQSLIIITQSISLLTFNVSIKGTATYGQWKENARIEIKHKGKLCCSLKK